MTYHNDVQGPYIPRFYEGRSVFITGATGFVGKLLVERLLSACPDVRRLYLLMREKNNMSPEDRLADLKKSPVFDVLRRNNPEQLDKIEMVAGDITKPDLGISSDGLSKLREVSVVFNSAATVRFNEELRTAVNQNLISVMRLLDLCDRLPSIQVLVHVSTAYCNAEHRVVSEKVYAPPMDIQALLQLMETQGRLEANKYIGSKPNTYTFTKAMAETALVQRGNTRYAIAIFRPSIVVSTLSDPFPGWIENLNGPAMVIAGTGTGLLRVSHSRSNAKADMLPADLAINTLLGTAWHTTIHRSKEIRVYNCTTGENPTTWGQFKDVINRELVASPLNNVMWYPHISVLSNRFVFRLMDFMLHKIPQYTVEYIKQLFRKKTSLNLIRSYQKLLVMNESLAYFSTNEWTFEDHNVREMRNKLSEEDLKIFNLDPKSIDWDDHITNFVRGIKKHIMKERSEDIVQAKARMRVLRALHVGSQCLLLLIFFRTLCRIGHFRQLMSNMQYNVILHGRKLFENIN